MKISTLVLGALFSVTSLFAQAETISIAVASNFTSAMKEIAAAYEQESDNKVTLSFGSSGKFFAQIKNGAPFQAFFSADQAKPVALDKNGMTVPGSRFTYAVGALALWSQDAGKVDENAGVLKSGDYSKLAIANPKLAPYGVAAMETLASMGLTDAATPKLVQGENISQTYQFVLSGNAPIGFVALSQIMVDGKVSKGSAWIVPADMHKPIRQDAVILKSAQGNETVKDFLEFVQSDKAKAIIHRYGYQTE